MSKHDRIQLSSSGVWWPHSGYLWAEGGVAALPPTMDYHEALATVKRYEEGEYHCSRCGKWFPKPCALSHFAGRYCQPCADEYKEQHAALCLRCHEPRWHCTC
jgi:hypothetical protein